MTGGLHVPKQQRTTSLTLLRERYMATHERRTRGCHGHVCECWNSKRTTGRGEWDRVQATTRMQCYAHDNVTWMNATHAHDKTTKTRKDEEPGMELMKPKLYILPKRESITSRALQTLLYYKKISSRDLGLEEGRILGTKVIFSFPRSFSVGMV